MAFRSEASLSIAEAMLPWPGHKMPPSPTSRCSRWGKPRSVWQGEARQKPLLANSAQPSSRSSQPPPVQFGSKANSTTCKLGLSTTFIALAKQASQTSQEHSLPLHKQPLTRVIAQHHCTPCDTAQLSLLVPVPEFSDFLDTALTAPTILPARVSDGAAEF